MEVGMYGWMDGWMDGWMVWWVGGLVWGLALQSYFLELEASSNFFK